jgi:hypothetical protein
MNFQSLCFCNVWNEIFDKIECNVTYYHNKLGGLMVRVCASILKVKGSNLTNGVCMVNNDKLIGYSYLIKSLAQVPRSYVHRLSF